MLQPAQAIETCFNVLQKSAKSALKRGLSVLQKTAKSALKLQQLRLASACCKKLPRATYGFSL